LNVEISNLPISIDDFDDILADIQEKIESATPRNYISITNTESMYHAERDKAHFDYIKQSNHSLCDGIGVCVAGYTWGVNVPRRNGPILMLKACEHGIDRGWKHYFYGGKEGVADLLEEKLKEKYPSLQVVGKYCPPFRSLTAEENRAVLQDIEQSKPDIIWVGLGLLKQEAWIAEWRDKVDVPWMVGVGAAFDYHAGTVPWAPAWIQAIGMEWLYRLIIQPKLRMKRYVWSFHFMFKSMFDGLVWQLKSILGKTNKT